MAWKLDDQPTIWDGLDRSDLLYEVAMQVSSGPTPQVIAVTGDWGSGKTSFLRQLQVVLWPDREDPIVRVAGEQLVEHVTVDTSPSVMIQLQRYLLRTPEVNRRLLDAAPDERRMPNEPGKYLRPTPVTACPVIWFDAWRYQNEGVPVVALLHEIRNAFSSGQKFWRFISRNGRAAVESALLSSESIAEAIALKAPAAKGVGKFYENFKKSREAGELSTLSVELPTEKIERLLTHDIGSLLKAMNVHSLLGNRPTDGGGLLEYPKYDRRLVIIIDDLDRCESEMAARMLEGIKVFLSIPNCVFVLGVNDQRLVDHVASLQDGYKADDADFRAKCRHKAKDYLDKIINRQYPLGISRSRSELGQGVFTEFTGANWNCSAEELSKVNSEIKEFLNDPFLLPPNPRKLKSFLATLSRFEHVRFEWKPSARRLFVFAYLAHFHPRILRKMSYYKAYREAFFQWVAETPALVNTFDGLVPHPNEIGAGVQARVKDFEGTFDVIEDRYHDPIDDNVFHVHRLAKEVGARLLEVKTIFSDTFDRLVPKSDPVDDVDSTERDNYVESRLQAHLAPYYLLS